MYGRIKLGKFFIRAENIYMIIPVSQADKFITHFRVSYIIGDKETARSVIITKGRYGYDFYYCNFSVKTLTNRIMRT